MCGCGNDKKRPIGKANRPVQKPVESAPVTEEKPPDEVKPEEVKPKVITFL
jgi:hypothetical protein